MEQTIKSLREAADKLDDVWKDCKIAKLVGTTGVVASGVISLSAIVLTGGVASPLLYAGLGLGFGGLGINLGTGKIETAVKSAEIEKAEKLLKETSDSIINVQQQVTNWLNKKEIARIVYIFILSKHLNLDRNVMNLLRVVVSFCLGPQDSTIILKTTEMVVTAVSQEGIKATAKTAKELGAQLADDVVQAAEGAAATAGGSKVGAQFTDDVVQGGVEGAKATAERGKFGAQFGGVLTKAWIVVSVAFLMYDVLDLKPQNI